jgi:hypothetical protein
MSNLVVVDCLLDDGSALVFHQGRVSIAEGEWESGEHYDIAAGDFVVVPRVVNEPIDLIARAWPGIVGDAARHSLPVAISGTALVVKTESGAWSHQLSFLEREIIKGVCALRVASIARLRFRIGRLAA